ncbi:O-succinylbenzoate synthase [Bacillus sp. FJAT-18017]|uniref:o-succinylbenzoate synthase n=1 Tax=Bacillus sp. FJAT-18017 TaxID=1705566 RepID=UPI0006B00E53|nr:o-succinylbenzoate synthase [Bacillus sp. FJAT-18017]ALC89586.1 O-succinylbenzoate synthase [Bacillus sp. FJAT-18017]
MNLHSIKLSVISMPLKHPFHTHLETVSVREGILVEVCDKEGLEGYGEGVAFSSPWYTEETVASSFSVIRSSLIPLLQKNAIRHPNEVFEVFSAVRRNHMAKSAVEMALWDLFSKEKGKPLSRSIGSEKQHIPSGVVVAARNEAEALEQTARYVEEGYQRIKVKIGPSNDYSLLSAIRRDFPELPIMADANSAYTLKDADKLKALDDLGLLMIEQPLAYDDFIEHAKLQKMISTPICLDESISSYSDVVLALEMGSCKILTIKAGKVGGLREAIRIHDYCKSRGIQVWCGGMIEFGVSRAHNVALASLPGFTIPGDISSSSRFWEEDIITPEITVKDGWISIPEGDGIGFELNRKRLSKITVHTETFTL